MITTQNPITTEQVSAQTYSGIWIKSIQIQAPDPSQPISVNVRVIPFNPDSGSLAPAQYMKNIIIQDIIAESKNSPELQTAMNAIFFAIQAQIISKSIY